MSKKDEIIRVFKREVMAHPEGAVVHMGDCHIYNSFLGVCTCGLHHWLWQAGDDVIDEIYPKLLEENSNEGFIEYLLQKFEREDNLYQKKGEEFVKIERPKPVPQEVIDKMFE